MEIALGILAVIGWAVAAGILIHRRLDARRQAAERFADEQQYFPGAAAMRWEGQRSRQSE